jgi:hypothetical protein
MEVVGEHTMEFRIKYCLKATVINLEKVTNFEVMLEKANVTPYLSIKFYTKKKDSDCDHKEEEEGNG